MEVKELDKSPIIDQQHGGGTKTTVDFMPETSVHGTELNINDRIAAGELGCITIAWLGTCALLFYLGLR